MKALLEILASHGPMLLLGVSVLLTLAAILVCVHRQPIHRQRIAEATMGLCVVFLLLASVPLPRFRMETGKPAPVRTLPLYQPQAGDEVIAAEVFKVARAEPVREMNSTGIGVPLPMPPESRTPTALRRNWNEIMASVYVGGVGVCVLYSILGHVLLWRLVVRSKAAEFARPDPRVRVRISGECDRPISFGLLRPTILLPARFAELDGAKQQHILRHELAHIWQRDALGHWLFNLLFPILYFHPLYWLLRRQTNFARELIADDLAAALSSRESYVADLLALARERIGWAAMASHALGLFQSKTDLYRRMHMLMQTNVPLARRCSNGWRLSCSILLVMALLLVSGAFGVRRANAQAADADQKAVDKRNADEQAAVAAQRQGELDQLRAQQAQIKATLDALTVEKQQLQDELAKRKAEGAATDNGQAAVYKRMLLNREQAVQQAREADAAAMLAKIAANPEAAAAERDKDQKLAWKRWNENREDGNREQKEFAGRAQLDLVSLANSYVDAVGNLQLAQLEFNRLNGKEKVFTQYEMDRAKVEVVKAERKVQIFRAIAQAALEAAKADLEVAMQQVKMGLGPKNAVNEPQSRLKILEVILAQ
jgi:beta-lactamase regulating signal transducer with metallopeptidase domain